MVFVLFGMMVEEMVFKDIYWLSEILFCWMKLWWFWRFKFFDRKCNISENEDSYDRNMKCLLVFFLLVLSIKVDVILNFNMKDNDIEDVRWYIGRRWRDIEMKYFVYIMNSFLCWFFLYMVDIFSKIKDG